MYIPDTQKWIHYYQNLGKNGHNPYTNYSHHGKKQIGGGSISGSPRQFITPIGQPSKFDQGEKYTINLVSPVQQTIDQAKDEVERTEQGIKRKRSDDNISPTRKRQRRQTHGVRKDKKKKHQKQSVKRPIKSTKKSQNKGNKKKLNTKQKKTNQKRRQLIKDIFSK